MPAVLRPGRDGTVIRSWLLDLLVLALKDDPGLAEIGDYVEDSGEGRWTIEAAIENAVPMPVITAALFARFASRQDRLAGDEGGRGAAQPVRRARREVGGRPVRHRRASTPGRARAPDPPRTDMHLRHLAVADFRSWERAELDLEPGVTVLVGPNGVGKTNLVEAVGYLATLGSHRVATDAPLIRRGAARAVVRGQVVHHGRELCSRWRSPRGGPTGPGSTGRR